MSTTIQPELTPAESVPEIAETKAKIVHFQHRLNAIKAEIDSIHGSIENEASERRRSQASKSLAEYVESMGKVVPEVREVYLSRQEALRKLYHEKRLAESAIDLLNKDLFNLMVKHGRAELAKASAYYRELTAELGDALLALGDIYTEVLEAHTSFEDLHYFIPRGGMSITPPFPLASLPIGNKNHGNLVSWLQHLIDDGHVDYQTVKDAGYNVRKAR